MCGPSLSLDILEEKEKLSPSVQDFSLTNTDPYALSYSYVKDKKRTKVFHARPHTCMHACTYTRTTHLQTYNI
ncbi:hypothetical protein AMTRI_Chr01g137710 [Amborella trichopoda]